MALGATMVWRVRAGGNSANGGGYDAAVSGAGTDYTDQDSSQLSLSDLTTTGANATIGSATGGFTSAMVGNVIRISTGTNFTAGYYTIITYTNTNTIVVDRNCATGVGALGVGRIGGAHAKINQYSNGGSGTAPTLTTPLAAGHTVYVRGAGNSNPSSADYNHDDGYLIFPAGSTAAGLIRFIGYNGRPLLTTSNVLIFYQANFMDVSNMAFVASSNANATHGFIENIDSAQPASVRSCIFNSAGIDCVGVSVQTVVGNWFKNSGSSSAGTNACITSTGSAWSGVPGVVYGNFVDGWRGTGIALPTGSTGLVARENIIANCHQASIGGIDCVSTTAQPKAIIGNTIYNCAGDGIKIGTAAASLEYTVLMNNICSTNTGYGLNINAGSTALNDRSFNQAPDYNCFYNNAGGVRNNVSAGAHDSTADPQFTNAGSGDFSIGTNLKALGFPAAFASATTTAYVDIGAVQRQEAGSGGLSAIGYAG